MGASTISNSDEFQMWRGINEMATSNITTDQMNRYYASMVAQQQQIYANPIYYAAESAALWPIRYEPQDNSHNSYKSRNLKEYSTPEFSKIKDILPKHMVPHAVMCPKEDIKSRIQSYLTN